MALLASGLCGNGVAVLATRVTCVSRSSSGGHDAKLARDDEVSMGGVGGLATSVSAVSGSGMI